MIQLRLLHTASSPLVYRDSSAEDLRFGKGLKGFMQEFNTTRGKTSQQIEQMLLNNGFKPVAFGVFCNDEGVKVHIDDTGRHAKHIDLHKPGEKKQRIGFFA
jgi:hypothetical protein